MGMKRLLYILGALLLVTAGAFGQTVGPCGTGATAWNIATSQTPACGVSANPGYGDPWEPTSEAQWTLIGNPVNSTTVTSTAIQLAPPNGAHAGWGFLYGTAVNVQAFKTTYQFVPNGVCLNFSINNAWSPSGAGAWDFPWAFSGGAGNECGISQFAGGPNVSPNNVWAMYFDNYDPLTNGGSFSYSSVQMYQSAQSPYMPVTTGGTYLPEYPTNKISTSPVPLNSPATTQGSPSTDTFQATIVYTGTTVTTELFDVTAGGSCPGATCFTQSWTGVNIPGITGGSVAYNTGYGGPGGVAGNTGYIGFNAGTSGGFTIPALQILYFTFSSLSAASAPTFSVAGGSYGSTQSLTLSGPSGSTICWNTTGAPYSDGFGNCPNGTKYTGAISVSGSETVFAVAGAGSTAYGDSNVGNAAYVIGSTPSQPTMNPPTGTYQGNQTLYMASPQSIFYNTTGSPTCSSTAYTGPITISSNETVYAVACSGSTPSSVASATYTLNPFAGSGAPNAANTPSMSPVPGTYSTAQSVTLTSTTTSGTPITCYALITPGSLPPASYLLPWTDNGTAQAPPNGSVTNPATCNGGTAYTGPITVPTGTWDLYAMTGTTYTSLPSSVAIGRYVITGTGTTPPTQPTPIIISKIDDVSTGDSHGTSRLRK